MTLLEAGACGLPSVVTDVGGNAEVVKDGVTGIVVPSCDEAAMSKAFWKLFEDADLRRKMGDNARLRIEEEYSLDKMVQAYQKLYEEALK
ncbi:MAG: glycosyltransferase [Proteobacteria bacterium]|nr:glycosyltransferase [Pseudomonadota bacterium]